MDNKKGISEKLMDKDLYGILGVLQNATEKQIKTAYRKKALECHPDKNPDDPKAAEQFLELTQILEVLIDACARAAYDKLLSAKLAAKKRTEALDSKRRKIREELEERERLASQERQFDVDAIHKNFEAELDRLRKESSRQIEEEVKLVREQIMKRKMQSSPGEECDGNSFRVKVRWSPKVSLQDYTEESLRRIFSKYGDVSAIVVSKKKTNALIEFTSLSAAENAVKLELGLPNNGLTVTRLWVKETRKEVPSNGEDHKVPENVDSNRQSSTPTQCPMTDDDYEAMVLTQLKRAAEKIRNSQ